MSESHKTEQHKTDLARIRKARGFTQTDLAYDLGVSKATYSSWESGRIELGAERIRALADRLLCTPNDILGYTRRNPDDFSALMELTDEERRLVKLFRQLPPNIKNDILDIMRYSAKSWRSPDAQR